MQHQPIGVVMSTLNREASCGLGNDWRARDGTCWGIVGFLVDNYYALLAVMDRQATVEQAATKQPGQ